MLSYVSQVPKSAFIGEVKIFKSIDIYVAGRASFWYALSDPLSQVTQSPSNPPHSPRPSRLLLLSLTVVSQALIGGDGDSLRRSIDEFLSQVLLLTVDECPRD